MDPQIELVSIEIRVKDDLSLTLDWMDIDPVVREVADTPEAIKSMCQTAVRQHFLLTNRKPIQLRWNNLGSMQGHYVISAESGNYAGEGYEIK
jgi:hypothetical protein